MITVRVWCKQHPKYAAKKPPKVACEQCWDVFLFRSDSLTEFETAPKALGWEIK